MINFERIFSPSQHFKNIGCGILRGLASGKQKACIYNIKSKFKPYELPFVRWTYNHISILKYDFEELKRWYDDK